MTIGADPMSLVGLVVDRMVSELTPAEASSAEGRAQPEEILAAALGNRLARAIAGDDWTPHFEALVARNSDLAGALGACDCWGEDPACPVCQGAGQAGWAQPDPQLYETYVRPAAKIVPSGTRNSTHLEPQETDDDDVD